MTDMILHHYPGSPFSEKVRVALGIKRLAWKSVTIPVILPKPDLMPLTGGYRKTPVLQIGADVYCDTQLILREIERRAPEPTLYPSGTRGLAEGLGWWAERSLFGVAVAVLFAKVGSALPQAFIDDRSKFSGRDFNPQGMKAAEPMMLDAFRAQLHWLETSFSDGKPFLFGASPSAADCSLYHMVWFVRNRGRAEILTEFPGILAWADRLAAIGHGAPVAIDAQDALAIAKAAEPATPALTDSGDPSGRRPGEKVSVSPDDTGRDPVSGELVASSIDEIAIRRHDPLVGEVTVHFPRAGFVVTRV
jgi:glutathione S-transferase